MRNPVRDVLLRKLEQTRVEIVDGRVEQVTNLEALADVIFENALRGRGRTALENARLLFEYAVGKPKNTLEIESGKERPFEALTREEILEEQMRAARELGIDAEWRVVDECDFGLEEGTQGEGHEGARRLPGPRGEGVEGERAAGEEGGQEGKEDHGAGEEAGGGNVRRDRQARIRDVEAEIEAALRQRQDDQDYYEREEDF